MCETKSQQFPHYFRKICTIILNLNTLYHVKMYLHTYASKLLISYSLTYKYRIRELNFNSYAVLTDLYFTFDNDLDLSRISVTNSVKAIWWNLSRNRTSKSLKSWFMSHATIYILNLRNCIGWEHWLSQKRMFTLHRICIWIIIAYVSYTYF